MRWSGFGSKVAVVVIATALVMVRLTAPPAFASEGILGEGSTWAFPAVSAWAADVARENLTVNYNDNGSAAGRSAFWTGLSDFTVSDIPFQVQNCPPPGNSSCVSELADVSESGRTFQYMPIVAGGTSLMYHLTVNGSPFTSLRLDSETVAKIFTGVITNWDDPEIAANNPGVNFPDEPIHVVVRSDGSGASYQFSNYLANTQPALWTAFGEKNQLYPPNAPTEYYPQNDGEFEAVNGSDSVANTIAAPYSEGTIGYDETAYALENNLPIVSIKNAAGVYTQPTAQNVAVALTAAQLQPNHTELLSNVFTNPDPRTYPISSYSYIIAPTNTTASPKDPWNGNPFNASKGVTLTSFINYLLCQGQQEAQPLGYSPLPPNLVQVGFGVEQQIPGAVPTPSIYDCNNPTITGCWLQVNHIPQAPSCSPHSVPGAPASPGSGGLTSTRTGSSNGSAGNSGTTGARSGGTAGGGGVQTASAATGSGGSSRASGGSAASPARSTSLQSNAGQEAGPQAVSGKPVSFGHDWGALSAVAAVVGVVVLLLAVLGPPGVGLFLRRRDSSRT